MREAQCFLVLAPNWLGDAIMALPAIADVKRAFPSARLVVAARPSVIGVFRFAPYVDDVVAARIADVETAGADVAMLLPNSFASAWLVWRAGVPERWGYNTDWRGPLLTRAVRRPGRSVHQGAYYQHLTSTFDIQPGPLEPALDVAEPLVADARALLSARGWNGVSPLVLLAPGAAYGTAKRWIPTHVAALIDTLASTRQATCALVGSRGDGATARLIGDAVAPETRARLIDLTGQTTLAQLAGVLRLAQACVTNDSGAMHLAGAIGTPLVALFGPTREHETAPLTRAGGRAEVLTNPVWCRPCMLRECPIDHRCMTGITPQRVYATVERLLSA